jgi:CubicO group peptidase (beta-lactamase class C family)
MRREAVGPAERRVGLRPAHLRGGTLLLSALLLAGCGGTRTIAHPRPPAPERVRVALPPPPALVPAAPAEVGMAPWLTARLDSIAGAAMAERTAPAVVMAVGRHGRLVHLRAYGRTHLGEDGFPVEERTLFDLASLTKVIAATTTAMILEEDGRLDLERPAAFYLPELTDTTKAAITVRMLLTHTAGFPSGLPLARQPRCTPQACRPNRGRDDWMHGINERPLQNPPGTATVYSDVSMITLQLVLERIAGQPLDIFLAQRLFGPLGMRDTHFSPVPVHSSRVAATSVDAARGGLIVGEVHDPSAWSLGGVSGNAGLFSSAPDLAVFAQMLLNGGVYDGVRVLRQETIARWTAPQGPGSSRALGWDTPSGRSSAGRFFSPRAFGHTGFTGTSLWIDPERSLFVVLLTNRVNVPGENQRHIPLRRAVADAVMEAVLDAPLVDWEGGRQ